MKKYISFILIALLFTACTSNENSEVMPSTDLEQAIETENEIAVEEEDALYMLVEKEFNEDNVHINYLEMQGYKGELTQDYINQSLESIVEKYKKMDFFESVEINPVIWMTSDDLLCVTYEGIATISEGNTTELLHPIIIDVESSNEVNYENLITDDLAVRALIEEKVIADGIAKTFEAEGIRVYMNAEFITFAYMPLDDSARQFVRVNLPIKSVKPYMNTSFGEHPAS